MNYLLGFYQGQIDNYRKHPAEAKQVAVSDAVSAAKDADVADLAAWTTVCRSILNLDETISRP